MSRIVVPQPAEVLDRGPAAPPRLGVEAGGRLVEEDQIRIARQGQGEVQAAPLAARQLTDLGVSHLGELHDVQQLAERARVRVVAAPGVDELGHPGLPREPALLQDHPGPLAELGRLSRRIEAEDADRAAGRRPEALQDLQRGGLPRAVRAEQAEHLAVADVEVHAPQHLGRAVALPQVTNLDREAVRRRRPDLIYDARVSHYPDYMSIQRFTRPGAGTTARSA